MGTVSSTICVRGTSATRTADFTVATSDMSEAGQYQCRATVIYMGTNDQYVEEPSTTESPDATLQCKFRLLPSYLSTSNMCHVHYNSIASVLVI